MFERFFEKPFNTNNTNENLIELKEIEYPKNETQKVVLRLASDIYLKDIPEDLKEAICSQIGIKKWCDEYFDVKLIELDENHHQHFIERVQAINEGVYFLLSSPLYDHFIYRQTLFQYLNLSAKLCINYIEHSKENEFALGQTNLANYLDHVLQVLSQELNVSINVVREQLARAEELALALKTKPIVCTISKFDQQDVVDQFIVQLDQPLNPFDEQTLKELILIKRVKIDFLLMSGSKFSWFDVLSKDEKKLIHHFLQLIDEKDLGVKINAFSSKFRLIPVSSNYMCHNLITFLHPFACKEPLVKIHPRVWRSSHIASRDVRSKSKEVRKLHAIRNFSKQLNDIVSYKTQLNLEPSISMFVVMNQNTITPTLGKQPDTCLEEDRQEVVHYFDQSKSLRFINQKAICLISTNHSLNYGQYVSPTNRSTVSGKQIDKLLSIVNYKYFSQPLIDDKNSLLSQAKQQLELTLDHASDGTSQFWNYKEVFFSSRELYIAALCQLIINEIDGCAMGGCVSGKDREAIVLMFTDAMRIFYYLHGRLPLLIAKTEENLNDQNEFSHLFAQLFGTKHHMFLAACNAPGSFGIKTPKLYLPSNLIDAVTMWYQKKIKSSKNYLKFCREDTVIDHIDRLASNNDLDKIKAMSVNKDLHQKNTFLPELLELQNCLLYEMNTKSIKLAYSGIDCYLNERNKKLTFISNWFDHDRGEYRARAYKIFLQDNEIGPFLKDESLILLSQLIIITALLKNADGNNMRLSVVNKLGFFTIEQGCRAVDAYMKFYMQQEVNKGNLSQQAFQKLDEIIQFIINEFNNIKSVDLIPKAILQVREALVVFMWNNVEYLSNNRYQN